MLDVAWLKVVKDVGDFEAAQELNVVSAEFEVEGILDFGVETDECRESPCLVPLADVVPIDADVGVGEAGVNIGDVHELQALRELDDAPEKDPVRSVVREGAVLIGAN